MRIRRALLSVTDKSGIEEFARGLSALGVQIISSGGTARVLSRAGVAATPVAEVTGAPEMLDGRVKTLHPTIHAAILADRRKPQHLAELKANGIIPIDMVVCNLYAFELAADSRSASHDDVIEQIDIGGPAMLRAAAKNYRSVLVVVNPQDYSGLLSELQSRSGSVKEETRLHLAAQAFAHTARYDSRIAAWFAQGQPLPETYALSADKVQDLRYGENPHQAAAFYSRGDVVFKQLAGKELSYTNLLDIDAAWRLSREFDDPAAVIIKHTNPCGCATAGDLQQAYERAVECDPKSAFGGVVALNRSVDEGTARAIGKIFTEVVVAPSYDHPSLDVLAGNQSVRILQMNPEIISGPQNMQIRSAASGLLVQEADNSPQEWSEMKVMGPQEPDEATIRDLMFAWAVAKHTKSNAIVLAKDGAAVGVGAGQMSRVEAVDLAVRRAGDRAAGSVCASDAFFPFRDGVDAAVAAGVRAIIQPGGSVRDAEVIAAASEAAVPMIFTGKRHFRH